MRKYKNSPLGRLLTLLMVAAISLSSVMVVPGISGAANTSRTSGGNEDQLAPAGTGLTPHAQLSRSSGPLAVIIELNDEPAIKIYSRALARGRAEADSRLTANSVEQQKSRITVAQASVNAALQKANLGTRQLFAVQYAYNGIAVVVDAAKIAQIEQIPGVKAVHELPTYSLTNASSVPLIGADQVWGSYGITGTNVKIGIIDSGIDYVHTDFGGPGTAGAYAAAQAVTSTAAMSNVVMYNGQQLYPNAKVVGGFDLAGDSYDANPNNATYNPIPTPDGNPLDCGGHGTHVAGTATGLGVNTDGTTYAGPYDANTPSHNFRVGPGVAPGAKLYSYRVFGCSGSTDLVIAALDRAAQDHVDVVNMSLGSDLGGSDQPDTVVVDNLSEAGIAMAIAAGNAGDTHFIAGSPGSSVRAVTTAASADSTAILDGFRINAPAGIAGVKVASRSVAYPWDNPGSAAVAVPVTATIFYPFNAADPLYSTGCEPFTANDLQIISTTHPIVLLDWAPAGIQTYPFPGSCGSVARGNRVSSAGAYGAVVIDYGNDFSTALTGSAAVPVVFTQKSTGDAIKANLTPGLPSTVSVTLSNEYDDAVPYVNDALTDTLASFSSRGPVNVGNFLKPDISAPGLTVFSAKALSGNKGLSENGTSMATPHMAGVLALLRQKHPDWTVEEIKALAMNTAGHNVWSDPTHTLVELPSRQGAGRVDVPAAISSTVIAFNADLPGAVSLSFGEADAVGTNYYTHTVTVENKGNQPAQYTLSYSTTFAIPGVTYTFPHGNTISVPANGSATFPVVLVVDGTQVKHYRDATEASSQLGFARDWLTEATGLVLMTPTSGITLRVPVYASVRAASAMSAGGYLATVGSPASATFTLPLQGQGLSGSNYPTDTLSLVTALEWQGSNPITTNLALRYANVVNYGVGSNYKAVVGASQPVTSSIVLFGLSTADNFTSPSADGAEFDIHISLSTSGAFTDDYVIYNYRQTDAAGANPGDVFKTIVVKNPSGPIKKGLRTNYLSPDQYSMASFNNNVIVLSALAGDIGLSANQTKFRYYINSYGVFGNKAVNIGQNQPPLTYDIANPSFDISAANTLPAANALPIFPDLPNNSLNVSFNQANQAVDNGQGVLLLHHFNTFGNRDQAIGFCANFVGVNKAMDDGSCGTLSYAIKAANASGSPVTVNLSGVSGNVITVMNPLPAITAPMTIDGGSANCTAGGPSLVINGTGVAGDGLVVKAAVNLSNLKVTGFGGRQLVVSPPGHVVTRCTIFKK